QAQHSRKPRPHAGLRPLDPRASAPRFGLAAEAQLGHGHHGTVKDLELPIRIYCRSSPDPYYTKFPYHGRNMNTKSTIVGLGRQYGGVSMTRRRFLGLACTVSASAALVACGGAGSSTSALASAVSGKPAASAAFASKSTSRLK